MPSWLLSSLFEKGAIPPLLLPEAHMKATTNDVRGLSCAAKKGGKIRLVSTISRDVKRNLSQRQNAPPSGRSRTTSPDLLRNFKRDIPSGPGALPPLNTASAAGSHFPYCKTKFETCHALRKEGKIRCEGTISREGMRGKKREHIDAPFEKESQTPSRKNSPPKGVYERVAASSTAPNARSVTFCTSAKPFTPLIFKRS